MSNYIEHKDLKAFHPGNYIEEELECRSISQEEFAKRLGTIPKTVSKLINGQINISNDLAKKISMVFGSSAQL